MIISHLTLKNWRNFRSIDVDLQPRTFIVGANASGKSNILDAIRFLRDIVKSGGGLQKAVRDRGGVSKIRCLSAQGTFDIELHIHLAERENTPPLWKYEIGFRQENIGGSVGTSGTRAAVVYERVFDAKGKCWLNRPDEADNDDSLLLQSTSLEQPRSNRDFRPIAEFLESIQYLHVVPQLLRDPDSYSKTSNQEDVYGRDFFERISHTAGKTRDSYLSRIEKVLTIAIPQLANLKFIRDDDGKPHLQASYKHWRATDALQQENQFSDGTLRLIGFLWSLQDGSKPLLLEEPELSLHSGVVRQLPEIIAAVQQKRHSTPRQVILTTHSADILSNSGIALEEVIVLETTKNGTEAYSPAALKDARALLNSGISVADIVRPRTEPKNIEQMTFDF
jgi:predicted ATPase